MAELSQRDVQIITKHPIDDALDPFRQSFASFYGRTLARRLIVALQSQEAAQELPSRTSKSPLSDDLAAIFTKIGSGGLSVQWTAPLCELVIDKASDEAIWKGVLDLIARGLVTPPLSLSFTRQDTPITHSSASQQGSEQTRELVDPRIFEEIRYCTHQNVDGFFEKYFDKMARAKEVEEIYQVVKLRHVDGKWEGFPNPPVQDQVLDWFFKFQSDFFSSQRGTYYTTHDHGLVGSDAKHQLDLLVGSQDPKRPASEHNWADVWVIGELKEGEWPDKPLLIQLAAYAREVFSSQPARRFVHGFTVRVTRMQLWVFDRSGPFSATEFDIHEQPKRFFQAIASYFITVIENGNEAEKRLQLDPEPIVFQRAVVCRGTNCYRAKTIGAKNWEYVVKLSWGSDERRAERDLLKLAQERRVEGVAELFAHNQITSIAELREGLKFSKPHKFQQSRASTSFSVSRSSLPQSFNYGLDLDRSSLSQKRKSLDHGRDASAKRSRSNSYYSFRPDPNSSLKRKAEDIGKEGVKRSRLNSHVSAEVGSFKKPVAVSHNRRNILYESSSSPYENRIFRVLVISPPGRPIHSFKTIKELLEAFRDAIKAHKSLYTKGKILHRDISENNIIITDDESKGMLMDLDLAKELGSERSGARHRTGTMEFMAIEVLRGKPHTYRHDLESFFYVFLWLLKSWYQGNYEQIASSKKSYMDKGEFEKIIAEFPWEFGWAKNVARQVRDILFPIREGALFTGTLEDPDLMYNPVIEAYGQSTVNQRYDFAPEQPTDLGFKTGDHIFVVQEGEPEKRWKGSLNGYRAIPKQLLQVPATTSFVGASGPGQTRPDSKSLTSPTKAASQIPP
ncbi:MAG: hypothetical protein M1814_006286 [Vezdaea aestivalis]|nr:MAG: hypothetical protein M1814_006286 [Vezdaea aestivalis]